MPGQLLDYETIHRSTLRSEPEFRAFGRPWSRSQGQPSMLISRKQCGLCHCGVQKTMMEIPIARRFR